MRDIALTMITVDRSPRANYLRGTVDGLIRSGLAESRRLAAACLSVGEDSAHGSDLADVFCVHRAERRLTGNENASKALAIGADTGAEWVLFMEDDVAVCAGFLDGVGRWLDRHREGLARIFSFGAAYAQISQAAAAGRDSWDYPVDAFYGTCCFAIRNEDARSLSAYWADPPAQYCHAYDLMVAGWMKVAHPLVRFHLAAAPCHIQHVGAESAISMERNKIIAYDWPGAEWAYL